MILGQISLLFLSIIDFLLEILLTRLKRNNSAARLRNVFALSRLHFNNDLISVSFVQCKLMQVYLDTRDYKQMDEVNHHHKKKYSWLPAIGQMVFQHLHITIVRVTTVCLLQSAQVRASHFR